MTRFHKRRGAKVGQVRFEGEISIDMKRAADVVSALAIGEVKRAVAEGRDREGRPLQPYSASYQKSLAEAGEDTRVDLRVTGGLMGSIGERYRVERGDTLVIGIGPDSGTSPEVTMVKGRAKRTGKRGPPHNILAMWLSRLRPFLGLSASARQRIVRALVAARLLK